MPALFGSDDRICLIILCIYPIYNIISIVRLPGDIDMVQTTTRTAPINLRAMDSQRNLIDKAAAILGKNRSDFMLETACREAENILLDQRLFMLNNVNFDAFMTVLDAPVKDNPALRHLMSRNAPWE